MDWSLFTPVFVHVVNALPSVVAAIVVLLAGRVLFLHTTTFDSDQDLVANRNGAFGVVLGAYLLGAALALSGSMFGRDEDSALVAASKTLAEGVLAIGLLRVSVWISDRLILYRFCIVKEIREDRNLGAAFCVAGSSIACGLILNGALTGFSKSFLFGLRDIFIFWFLGHFVLVLGAVVYQRITRYDVHQLIEYDDNAAVGIGFGGFLVSLGIVVRAALVGAGLEVMSTELPRTALLALIGVFGVIAVHSVAQFLLVPKADYEEEVEMSGNVAVSVATACASLAVAVLLAAAIQR